MTTGTDGDDMAATGATAGTAAKKLAGEDAVVPRDFGNKGVAETNRTQARISGHQQMERRR